MYTSCKNKNKANRIKSNLSETNGNVSPVKTYLTITVKDDDTRLELVVSTLCKSRITMLGRNNIIVTQGAVLRRIWRLS